MVHKTTKLYRLHSRLKETFFFPLDEKKQNQLFSFLYIHKHIYENSEFLYKLEKFSSENLYPVSVSIYLFIYYLCCHSRKKNNCF